MNKTYICIDLKSFYASVECKERNLDPLNTNLVVADESRTDKTICLAVTPSLKSYGIAGRARLFEVKQKVKEINDKRRKENNYRDFTGKSYIDSEVKNNNLIELDFIKAVPRMKLYMKYSTDIYNIYLKYIDDKDILVYSIDEVFCDISNYLGFYNLTGEELVMKIIKDIYKTTGITATGGVGTNMYLAKVAMDITAKKMQPNSFGVRIASLNEDSYKRLLWDHRPLTDFWRVGMGYSKKLEENNMFTMGDVARVSLNNEELLFKLFGVNAEFLIDHAWGVETCTIEMVKNYKPISNSISCGQVLHDPYDNQKAKLIVKEMVDNLVLSLVEKRLKSSCFVLTIIYDIENLTDPFISSRYRGEVVIDEYGRKKPKHAHGTVNIDHKSSSMTIIMNAVIDLFERITNPLLLIRKINLCAFNLVDEDYKEDIKKEQLNLFEVNDLNKSDNILKKEKEENNIQNTILDIKKKYGKNAILRGMNLFEGATMRDRNEEVGGHKG